ncbi:MAG: hypothetical protein ACTSQP_18810 [Promethearchaeota archaeon]
MVLEKRNEIWESENRNIEIENFIVNLISKINTNPKSNINLMIEQALRELVEEKKILEGKYE